MVRDLLIDDDEVFCRREHILWSDLDPYPPFGTFHYLHRGDPKPH